ncbi:bile acid:sodium symporter family protein [Bacillus luteolus]|uniref:Bile acid:sodium symporter family protein n=1 Tax=Litchfieldia luteola TaxID=682179 RepID=A0ABR9QKN5_9BACI|nr:bile acid:sodium symporter family protein [Cytobacillus luteolus]MBE4909068.1 bile acid:sodium symporter family protein [Cytobacillus luteolus]MBP1941924.1 putative Na+-dependent transporter [Cytobacillus luteolus]
MLQTVNKQLEKYMALITPTGVVLGVLFAVWLIDFTFLIPWIFAFITFAGSLSSNFTALKRAILHPLPIILALGLLHILMPVWAWSVGHLTFSGDVYTITGLILALVIPTGITSVLWVSICRGNLALTLSIILIDTLLSPFIVPYTLSIFVGTKVEMDVGGMMTGLFLMVVLPSLVGMVLNHITNGNIKESWGPKLAPFSKISLGLVVMLNGAIVAPYLRNVDLRLIWVAVVVFFVAFTGYLFAFLLGKLFKWNQETVIALTFTGGMRNISAGAVIATSFFPAQVAVPVVVGMLFQQLLASLFGYALNRHYRHKEDVAQRHHVG